MKKWISITMLALTAALVATAGTPIKLVGGSTLNGNFNANPGESVNYAATTHWHNLGSGGQTYIATDDDLTYDGSQNALIGGVPGSRISALDTGHVMAAGDVFDIAYTWRDTSNWDVSDRVRTTLFVTDDDTLTGVQTTLVEHFSDPNKGVLDYEAVAKNSLYRAAQTSVVDKKLFVAIDTTNTNTSNARLDNFELMVATTTSTTYYVDSMAGNDGNSGTNSLLAWASLTNLNATVFNPGDRILLKAGTLYTGRLAPQGSGTAGSPIVIDLYGEGPMPRIDGGASDMEALLLYNVEYWEVNHLEITNPEPSLPDLAGIRVHIRDFGRAHHIHLKNLYVHDVDGPHVNTLDQTGYGIYWHNEGDTVPSFFDGLQIENCHVKNVNCRGIQGRSGYSRSNWHPSINVLIRSNLVEQIGGAGITTIGTDGCLIEYNRVDGVGLVSQGNGIHPYKSDNTVIQYNEVSDCRRGSSEGWGYNSDGNCRNSLFQYNYSHDNEGGYHLIIGPDTGDWTVGCVGTVIRYNISVNDGLKTLDYSPTFNISGNVQDTHIYNNTIYIGTQRQPIELFRFHNGGGVWPDATKIHNNIFHVAGSVYFIWGGSTDNAFSHNVWYGDILNPPVDPFGTTSDPDLMNPGSLAAKDYRVLFGSVAISNGMLIADNGGLDYFGNTVSASTSPSIGAHEYQTDSTIDSDGDKMTDLWESNYGLNPLNSTDASVHSDSDHLINLGEYALGGDPNDGNDTGHPSSWNKMGTKTMIYVYPHRIVSDLSYWLETSTNLVSRIWTSSGYTELPATGTIDADFEAVSNEVPVTGTEGFLRLRIQ